MYCECYVAGITAPSMTIVTIRVCGLTLAENEANPWQMASFI